jgi:transcriptional repressor NrdR
MKCLRCGNTNTRVLDTREAKDGTSIRRRRECNQCSHRFATLETLVQSMPLVVKKDGRRETFVPEKILKGIQAACQKRPISLPQLEQIVEKLIQELRSRSETEISSTWIGKMVIDELKKLDDVAYVRFASVYKTFRDLKEFVRTLNLDPEVQVSSQLPPEAGH